MKSPLLPGSCCSAIITFQLSLIDFNGDPLSDLGVGSSSCRACGTLLSLMGWDESESLKLDGGDSSCPFFVADVLVKRQIII